MPTRQNLNSLHKSGVDNAMDVSSGLTLGLGKKTYASYASKGALMFWAKRWYQDKKPNWKKIYAEKAIEERVELLPLPEKLKTKTKSVQNNFFELVNNGQQVLTHTAEEYEIEYPQVQQQDNCHDCGIYVIKFMDLWKGRMASAELDHETVTDVRRRILASLLMDEMNEQRESIIQAVGLKT
ncbi:hypothetical protein Vadar_022762 [Vaccinium darrowii]|uniref:Uncharacterized protein n=1 Tax=Vaccinium darrowii TaxID=229202 RepID=A0ACB7X329_9ERIC|nr:hypothetical protein Vadar_022762 [Vaccinium darrowii]